MAAYLVVSSNCFFYLLLYCDIVLLDCLVVHGLVDPHVVTMGFVNSSSYWPKESYFVWFNSMYCFAVSISDT